MLIEYTIACEKLKKLRTAEEMDPIINYFFFIRNCQNLQNSANIGEINEHLLYYYDYFGFKREWLINSDMEAFYEYQKSIQE